MLSGHSAEPPGENLSAHTPSPDLLKPFSQLDISDFYEQFSFLTIFFRFVRYSTLRDLLYLCRPHEAQSRN